MDVSILFQSIYGFIILSLINVVLSTVKSVLTIKASPLVATIINTISYAFNALVIKQIAGFDMTTTLFVVIITNLIGVYTGRTITDAMRKDRLWKFEATMSYHDASTFKDMLEEQDIPYMQTEVVRKGQNCVNISVFSSTQEQSSYIKKHMPEDAKMVVFESKQ